MNRPAFRHVHEAWDDAHAASLDPLGRLVYRSNLLGSDQRITNTGGGNTSAKFTEPDPLTGKPVEVLWVKGSGGDLRTCTRDHFASLILPRLEELRRRYLAAGERGLKSPAEDAMVGRYPHAAFRLHSPAPSIDTPLHAFLPGKHVDHVHPNAIIAIAASERCEELTAEIFGGKVGYVPWMRPGFELGLAMQAVARKRPDIRAIMMGQHGLIAWADDDRECYWATLGYIETAAAYIEKAFALKGGDAAAFGGALVDARSPSERDETWAALLPFLRGHLSQSRRVIGTVQHDEATLRFVGSKDAQRLAGLGTSCPDHFLRTKIKPLYVAWDPGRKDADALFSALATGLEQYRRDYSAYYKAHARPDSPPQRDPNPTVILIPGVGLVAWGRDKSESRVTAEFYRCAIEVMRGAETVDRYRALPLREAFDIEYWALEEAKLRRMPAEKELARRIAIVIGAGSGIGRATAHRLAREGAHLVCVDLDLTGAETTAAAIVADRGKGVGVAGTGRSDCGPALALACDITKREAVRSMLQEAVLAYGGFDAVCVTAGIFVPSDTAGKIPDEKWALTFAINVTGSFLVADEAARIWRSQALRASLVLTTSANAVVAKRGSLAYDTSKAAANHLVRELAIDLAPLVRVNGVAPATVVEGSAMFPRDRVIGSLAKYQIPHTEADSTEVLVGKLAQFYADRTLTRQAITPADQAEAYFLWVSERLSKTTGQILAVDGGLHEAFLR